MELPRKRGLGTRTGHECLEFFRARQMAGLPVKSRPETIRFPTLRLGGSQVPFTPAPKHCGTCWVGTRIFDTGQMSKTGQFK